MPISFKDLVLIIVNLMVLFLVLLFAYVNLPLTDFLLITLNTMMFFIFMEVCVNSYFNRNSED